MMSNIRKIYHRDLHAIFSYRAAFITVTVLCLLPSLYTLVNVRAIWNPYQPSEVDHIPVAVVNRDTGTNLRHQKINLGNQVVANLHKNNQIGWRFASRANATKNLQKGKYYAEIEIPKDFSEKLTSIAGTHPQKAQLIYKTNTKNSPMGAKITSMAAKTLVTKIRQKFIYEVNRTIFSYLNIAGNKASENQDRILNLKDLIIALGDSMGLASNSLGTISDTSNSLALAFTEFKPVINASQNVDLSDNLTDGQSTMQPLVKKSLNRSFTNFGNNLAGVNESANQLKRVANQLNQISTTTNQSAFDAKADNLTLQLDLLSGQVQPLLEFAQAFNRIHSTREGHDLIKTLASMIRLTKAQKHQLAVLKQTTDQNRQLNATAKEQINQGFAKVATSLNQALIHYNHAVKQQMSGVGNDLLAMTHSSQDILGSLNRVKKLNNQSLNTAIQGNQLVASTSGKLEDRLQSYKDEIVAVSNQLKLTSDHDIANIITVLQSNPDLMGSALARPFTVKNEDIYKVNSFGAAFSPTYIALSIWVGCTMLVAVLKTKAPKLAKFRGLSVRDEYLGKLLTFGTLSLVQTVVIIGSAVALLKIHVASLFLMLMIGLISSVTFTIIVYTMAALFGNLGKALVVMLMAVQLAGSGAMYPVQLNPLLFRIFQPLFPFAYSVSGFREAIGGANMATVMVDVFVLSCMAVLVLAVGLSTKKPLKRYTDRLLDDFKKTGMS